MTDHDIGSLDGWDDELNDWTEYEIAALEAANVCIRHRPPALAACTQGYDHTGRCDWFAAALKLATRGGAA